MFQQIKKAATHIQALHKTRPQVGIVLGSGLGAFVDIVENPTIIPYSEIPFFRDTTVEGHEGRLIIGRIGNVEIAILQGRFHAYEGAPMEEVVFPVRVLAMLGIEVLVLTNAAGGINTKFVSGDLVIIEDHINMMAKNPLVGTNISELGPRFPDMTHAYDLDLLQTLQTVAKNKKIGIKKGVYAGVLGPTYETPAEIRMLRILGADMVGMSTVPESIAANHLGLRVAGISCITNMAAGIENVKLKHEDVKAQALKVMDLFKDLLEGFIGEIGNKGNG
ncbi:MAG: purine-nucleoside phosphorylase [Bdellovibrionales bacterium RIFOXYD12_FULL_39_22]|nr:MAG: purine-nucleoside phosphorylase [Bdellovibrionales bacterium RIFOXYB1_FULL_39_21]OFZ43389.1 MAG: purine-nucleoside phosphorylase [Bdellovibrionales bacterium RIFOXYC12_FULL_39_17]OFZ47386.1 MAG: purine-nucleoside phosphorylase [Bdellovibrionales bacterium RIFOXYC1_FULL_39_130]OFZ76266.1 MAG: purine-nucleoside phosphorylase [Bdellovibrionales bacterium RIFOXYD1_FULL_39_84]OFZ94304.1 MAG: purine-nucleoside phosphorylase [Bdellovibrionales bacterium RIFOXYD12_FULL_39_22]HLE12090.1 purine-